MCVCVCVCSCNYCTRIPVCVACTLGRMPVTPLCTFVLSMLCVGVSRIVSCRICNGRRQIATKAQYTCMEAYSVSIESCGKTAKPPLQSLIAARALRARGTSSHTLRVYPLDKHNPRFINKNKKTHALHLRHISRFIQVAQMHSVPKA